MIKTMTERKFFDLTFYEQEDGTMDEAWIDAFIEHSKASGAFFDIAPCERPDGSVDDTWVDAAIAHAFRRGAGTMKRLM